MQASSDNLTFWAGTGIPLPHCLLPAYIGKEKQSQYSLIHAGSKDLHFTGLIAEGKGNSQCFCMQLSLERNSLCAQLSLQVLSQSAEQLSVTGVFAPAGFSMLLNGLPLTPAKPGRSRAKLRVYFWAKKNLWVFYCLSVDHFNSQPSASNQV